MSFDFPMVAGDLDWDRPSFVSLCDELDRMIAFPLSDKYGLAHRTRDTLRQLRHLVNIVQDLIQLYGVVHSVVRAANARDAALLAMMAVSGMNDANNDPEHETTAKRLCRDGVQIAQLAYEAAIKNGITVLMQAHQTSVGLTSATRAMNNFISDFVAANEKKRKRNADDEAGASASTAAPAASASVTTSAIRQ